MFVCTCKKLIGDNALQTKPRGQRETGRGLPRAALQAASQPNRTPTDWYWWCWWCMLTGQCPRALWVWSCFAGCGVSIMRMFGAVMDLAVSTPSHVIYIYIDALLLLLWEMSRRKKKHTKHVQTSSRSVVWKCKMPVPHIHQKKSFVLYYPCKHANYYPFMLYSIGRCFEVEGTGSIKFLWPLCDSVVVLQCDPYSLSLLQASIGATVVAGHKSFFLLQTYHTEHPWSLLSNVAMHFLCEIN